MASTTSALDRTIFNQALYAQLRDFWFQGVPENATSASFPTLQKWFGMGTKEEKETFDQECHEKFGHALNAIGPLKFSLPPFESYEDEIQNADIISAPFLTEVKEAQSESEETGAQTLLSLVLLLDQMPRNTMRDQQGLRLVYNHYDRLAYSLLRSSMALTPSILDANMYHGNPLYLTWVLLPFMHSEHLESHTLALDKIAACRKECEAAQDTAAVSYIEQNEKAAASHVKVIEEFGRYPHRNECLGRRDTSEEEEYLKTADTFGVENSKKQPVEKSEL